VTLTNTGTAPLSITNVATSPSDFGSLNACGSSLAAGASCAIGVFFDPTVGGVRRGTLTITDNAGSPQVVALTGTGQDFSVTPSSTTSATVSAGQSANYSVGLVPLGGFAQNVTLSCSGAPAMANCSVSPSSISLSGTTSKTVMVTVTTTGASRVLPLGGSWRMDPTNPTILLHTAWIAAVLLIFLAWLRLLHRQNSRRAPVYQ
jgi:hypothetical protein